MCLGATGRVKQPLDPKIDFGRLAFQVLLFWGAKGTGGYLFLCFFRHGQSVWRAAGNFPTFFFGSEMGQEPLLKSRGRLAYARLYIGSPTACAGMLCSALFNLLHPHLTCVFGLGPQGRPLISNPGRRGGVKISKMGYS